MITRFFSEYQFPYSSLQTGLQTRLFIKTGRASIDRQEGNIRVSDANGPAAYGLGGGGDVGAVRSRTDISKSSFVVCSRHKEHIRSIRIQNFPLEDP